MFGEGEYEVWYAVGGHAIVCDPTLDFSSTHVGDFCKALIRDHESAIQRAVEGRSFDPGVN